MEDHIKEQLKLSFGELLKHVDIDHGRPISDKDVEGLLKMWRGFVYTSADDAYFGTAEGDKLVLALDVAGESPVVVPVEHIATKTLEILDGELINSPPDRQAEMYELCTNSKRIISGRFQELANIFSDHELPQVAVPIPVEINTSDKH